jgi:hypothetical protein
MGLHINLMDRLSQNIILRLYLSFGTASLSRIEQDRKQKGGEKNETT